ncbi:unnamed protein product [Amoebophrya sp. A25]|nr:unnamed protein product [Amoebophrya sp. A25]|eukprot:GSA25T00023244001.1
MAPVCKIKRFLLSTFSLWLPGSDIFASARTKRTTLTTTSLRTRSTQLSRSFLTARARQKRSTTSTSTAASSRVKKAKSIFADEVYEIPEDRCSCGCCVVTEVSKKLACRRISLIEDPMCGKKEECTEVGPGSYAPTKQTLYDVYCATYCSVPDAGGTSNAERSALNNAYFLSGQGAGWTQKLGNGVSVGNGGAAPQAACVPNEDLLAVSNEVKHTGLKSEEFDDSVTKVFGFFGFQR